jgi:endonuclease/exonuclease/phosphatase (EEP) superfamily protein YafD
MHVIRILLAISLTIALLESSFASKSYQNEAEPTAKNPIPDDSKVLKLHGFAKPNLKLNPNRIKILVWNMYKGDNPTWEKDFKTIRANHDILALQEMVLDKKIKNVFNSHTGHEYYSATSFLMGSRDLIDTGVATGSSIQSSKTFWQRSKDREPFINTPKMVLLTTYPIKGSKKKLLVANIHAINFVTTIMLERQITAVAEAIMKHDGPAIFGGDFNTWSVSKLSAMNKILEAAGMQTVKFDPKTDLRMKVFGNYIDYIWYKNLQVKSSKVWGHIEGADHKAMSAEFKYKY